MSAITSSSVPAASGEVLTHRECLARSTSLPIWLQIRRYHQRRPFTLCGSLVGLALGEDGAELFSVRTDIGTYTVSGRNARLCSGDGRCGCEISIDQ